MKYIKGKKGGESKSRKPHETPDNLISKAYAKILLALCEGETYGKIDKKDIYLDGTPCQNEDGTTNYEIEFDYRNGTQDQSYIQGMPEVANEITVDTEITDKIPWTKTFTNTELSAVRVRLKWPSLLDQNDDGDLNGYEIRYYIQMSVDGGEFETIINSSVNGKTTSGYERTHRIDLPQDGSLWSIRIARITPNSSSAKTADKMKIASYTEVIDAKLTYPHTSLLYIKFDASSFNGSIPNISVYKYGRIIRVPSNYDPFQRTYSGVWDGTFKWAWTNNPAWILYDIIIEERFALGDRIKVENLDRYEFYYIAQYCDELVPDGKGGKECRYTCDVYIQNRAQAFKVLSDFAAIFRGMTYWHDNQLVVLADMPRDTDYVYTRANIIDGLISYSSSTSKARYTSALVSYSDPANQYKDATEAVFDKDLIQRFKMFNQLELTAIGCTSQGEANRKGRWAILTNNKDRMVTFKVGLDGMIPLPGYIIGVADQYLSGKALGGRISKATGKLITLDRVPDATPNDTLIVNLPSGKSEERTIKSIYGNEITVVAEFSETPEEQAVWAIESNEVYIQRYRVTSIKNNDDNTFTITGVYYDPDKYMQIDKGAIIDARPISKLPSLVQSPPLQVTITSSHTVIQGLTVASMHVEWDKPEGAIYYEVQWRKDLGNWINASKTSVNSLDIQGIYAGCYEVRVCAINSVGAISKWKKSEPTELKGKIGRPNPPINFTATDDVIFGIDLKWSFPKGSGDTSHTEIQYSTNENEENALLLSNVPYPSYSHSQMGLSIGQVFFYRARLVDKIGNTSDWTDWVRGISSTNTNDLTDHIFNEIKETDAWNSLVDSIDNVVNNSIDNAKAIIENALANDIETKQRRIENSKLSAEIKETNAVLLSEKEATSIALKELHSKYGNVSSDLSELRQTTAEQNSATSKSIDSLTAKVGNVSSDLSQFKQVTTNQNSATAQAIQSINTKVGDVSTSISDVSKTVNNLDGKVSAQRSIKVKVDSKGQQYAAGMSIGVENTDQGMQSNVIFLADKFMVMNQANGDPVPAFIAKDGNVIMNSAVFGHASINFATISDTIQSENYVQGKSGWKLFKNGSFEINSTFTDGGRVMLNSDGLAVYDERNILRVLLGKLRR